LHNKIIGKTEIIKEKEIKSATLKIVKKQVFQKEMKTNE